MVIWAAVSYDVSSLHERTVRSRSPGNENQSAKWAADQAGRRNHVAVSRSWLKSERAGLGRNNAQV